MIGDNKHQGEIVAPEDKLKKMAIEAALAAGGAVQGHPGGATAGAKAMRQAIEIVMSGEDFESAAREKKELSEALSLWKYQAN